MAGPVGAVDLAKWQEVQQDIRHLTLQRGLRFVAAAVLAPFGVSAVAEGGDVSGPGLPTIAFGLALLLLAFGELTSIAVSGLLARERQAMEKAHTALAPKGKPGRRARWLTIVSGPGLSTALYALLGAAFISASILP
ncbi:MAG: hypothetical protein WC876_02195 [Candidatus Thermoplasmatota archaeon]|jgi:hypothetical protein